MQRVGQRRLRALLCLAAAAALPGVYLLEAEQLVAPAGTFRRKPLADVRDVGEPIRIAPFMAVGTTPGLDCSAPGDVIKLGEPTSPIDYCMDIGLNHGDFKGGDCMYTCVGTDTAGEEQMELLREVMHAVVEWFRTTVAVIPADVLSLPGLEACALQHNFTIPEGLLESEISGADAAVILTVRPLPFGQLASTRICTRDAWGRPTGAHVFVSPNVLPHSSLFEDGESIRRFLNRVLVHEVLHMLGFESHSLTLFRDEHLQIQQSPLTSMAVHDETVKAVGSPAVKAEVMRHYGSAELAGMPLASSVLAGSSPEHVHWHSDVAVNEIMTEVLSEASAVSNITLALLEDTGWYHINASQAEQWTWGKSHGSAFFTEHCSLWREGAYNCGPVAAPGCSYDRTSKATCSPPLSQQDVPWAMSGQQSVQVSSPSVAFLDCHVMTPAPEGSCLQRESASPGSYLPLEELGADSRCFMLDDPVQLAPLPVCLETKCGPDGSLSISLDGAWVKCPPEGVISSNSTSISCPPWYEVCPQPSECINDCSQAGICSQGICLCPPGSGCQAGRTGDDCSIKSCLDSCHAPNGECVDGVCMCSDGWAGVACSTPINANCMDDCSAYGTGAICVNGKCEKRCSASYASTCTDISEAKQHLTVCSEYLGNFASVCVPSDPVLLGSMEENGVWEHLEKLTTEAASSLWQHSPLCQESLLQLACLQTFPSCTEENPDLITPTCVSMCQSFHTSCNIISQESGLRCEAGPLFRADADPRGCSGIVKEETSLQQSLQAVSFYALFVLGSTIGFYCIYRVFHTWVLFRSYGRSTADWCRVLCCCPPCCRPGHNDRDLELELR